MAFTVEELPIHLETCGRLVGGSFMHNIVIALPFVKLRERRVTPSLILTVLRKDSLIKVRTTYKLSSMDIRECHSIKV